MKKLIDITLIDLRFEKLRLKNPKAEGILLVSIACKGVESPIGGILIQNKLILLDGFKRYRCAKKCKITELPYMVYSQDEMIGMLRWLKFSNDKSLHILEQAKVIKELLDGHQLSLNDIATNLGKSVFWVRMRITLLSDLTPLCLEKIFKGHFPVWCALGILRQLKRSHQLGNNRIDEFIEIVSGKGLSCRDIDLLARGYFGGFFDKKQLLENDFIWAIDRMKRLPLATNDLNNSEKQGIRDLEIAQKYIGRLIVKIPQWGQKNSDFLSMAIILAEGILRKTEPFEKILHSFTKDFCDDRPREK